MKTKLTIVAISIILFFGCQMTNTNKDISKNVNYFNAILLKEKHRLDFESDTEYGFIKIGNFLKTEKRNAIVISFDSLTNFKVYELQNDDWKVIFHQEDVDIFRIFGIEAFIEDYNFDGVNDIGLRNEVSNGTSIMTFHLWLNVNGTFIEIPEFQNIGNPTIVKNKNRIQGYSACCAFSEITLTNYEWNDKKLKKMEQLEISNYPTGSGINAHIIERDGITQRQVRITEKEINLIIDKFSTNLVIIDTTANIGFTSGGVTFFY